MKLTKRQKEFCGTIYDETDIDLAYYLETADVEDFDELTDYIQDQGGFDIEIIYYHTAMDFLKENDASLKESLELAHDLGFEANSLNSETLASILASQNARENFQEFEGDIETIIFKTE